MRIAVEFDPPGKNPDGRAYRSYVEGARMLKNAGADFLTIADNPCAAAKGDSVALSMLFSRAAGIPVVPHIACRDRNHLSLKSALLALDIAGQREILIVTGDPFRKEDREAGITRSNLTSAKFAALVGEWNKESFSRPFRLSAALNVNAPAFPAELRRAQAKIDAGISRFYTQPALTERAMENIYRAGRELQAELFGGILPVVSEANARFLAEGRIHGIAADPGLPDAYRGLGKEEASTLAVSHSLAIARAMSPAVDGFYIITPFSRTDISARITEKIRSMHPRQTIFIDRRKTDTVLSSSC